MFLPPTYPYDSVLKIVFNNHWPIVQVFATNSITFFTFSFMYFSSTLLFWNLCPRFLYYFTCFIFLFFYIHLYFHSLPLLFLNLQLWIFRTPASFFVIFRFISIFNIISCSSFALFVTNNISSAYNKFLLYRWRNVLNLRVILIHLQDTFTMVEKKIQIKIIVSYLCLYALWLGIITYNISLIIEYIENVLFCCLVHNYSKLVMKVIFWS